MSERLFRPSVSLILVRIVRDALIICVVVAFQFTFEYVLKLIGPQVWSGTVARLGKWVIMASATLLFALVVLEFTIGLYQAARSTFVDVRGAMTRLARIRGGEILSYLAGICGFAVVYALMSRAVSTNGFVAKLLIYTGAFVLAFEVVLLVAVKVKNRMGLPTGSQAIAYR